MKKIVLFTLAILLISTVLHAECQWEWVCDEDGECAQRPICESMFDIPPPRPPSIEPIVPPTVEPFKPLTIPPIGTRDCRMVRLCDGFGNCRWKTVCE